MPEGTARIPGPSRASFHTMRARALLAFLLAACGGAPAPIVIAPSEPGEADEVVVETVERPDEPADHEAAEVALPCALRVRTTATAEADGTLTLRAYAASASDDPVELVLPDRCPNGPGTFTGLPAGYDVYGTCNAGACPPAPPRRLTLDDAWTELAQASLDPRGGVCNAPLPAGHYAIGFELDTEVSVCLLGAAAFEVAPTPTVRTRPTRPAPTTPPAPPTAPSPTTRACPPMPACGLACPAGGFARDENGCTLCACDDTFGPGTL